MYRNEKGCGKALQNSGIDRNEIFLTTKIPPESMGYDRTVRAIESSLQQGSQEYYDLYDIRISDLYRIPRLTKPSGS